MNSPKVRLALAAMTLSACAVFYACGDSGSGGSTGDGGGGSGDDGSSGSGSSTGSSSGGTSGSGGSGGSGSGGASSGGSSASSSGTVYMCGGCIDTSGRCNDGGADNRCGHGSSTCVDCTTNLPPQVCGASGECINGSSGAGSSSSSSSSSSGGMDGGGGG